MRLATILLLLITVSSADEVVERLAALVRDADRGVRYAAVVALGKAGSAPAAIAEALRDPTWCIRQEAGAALAAMGERGRPFLVAALSSDDAGARMEAAEHFPEREVLPQLMHLLDEEDDRIVEEAAFRLGRLGRPVHGATAALIRALYSESFATRFEAACTLAKLDPHASVEGAWVLAEGLESRDEKTVLRACEAIRRGGERCLLALDDLVDVRGMSQSKEVKRAALEAIRSFGEAGRERLRYYGKSDARMREVLEALAARPEKKPDPKPTASPSVTLVAEPLCRRMLLWSDEELRCAVNDPDPAMRAAAVWALGRLEKALPPWRDPDPVVREMAGGTAAPRPEPARLDHSSWRVRRRALLAFAESGFDRPERLVPFLADPIVPLSEAARPALIACGGAAALPVARALADGHEGVLHHALRIFEALGPEGAPATAVLAGLLPHPNVNVREIAARCLAEIGPPAAAAGPALCRALGDARLCVVANAALALGRIGERAPLLECLDHERGRVRAYAAWALGWILGAERGVDQVPYEVRLPVMDCGPSPEVHGEGELACLRAGIRSKDPEIAVPCAARLDEYELDAWECERVMELLLPEDPRPGTIVDFEKLRSIIATSEIPAFIEYVKHARRTEPDREYRFGNLHRLPRADTLPALCYFHRTLTPEMYRGIDALWMPEWHTARYRELLARHGLGDEYPEEQTDGVPAPLRALLRDRTALTYHAIWWLQDCFPAQTDAAFLMALANRLAPGKEDLWVVLRALGHLDDEESERFLRSFVDEEYARWPALFALARRGLPDALRRLLSESETDEWALGLLLDARPEFANAELRRRLSDPQRARRCVELLGELFDVNTAYYGIRIDETVFDGLEEHLLECEPGPWVLADAGVAVPGCRTRRVAEAALARVERPPPEWRDGYPGATDAFLYAAAPERFTDLLVRWVREGDEEQRGYALSVLLRIGEPRVARELIACAYPGDYCEYTYLARTSCPEVERYLLGLEDEEERTHALHAFRGFPAEMMVRDPEDPLALLRRNPKLSVCGVGLLGTPEARAFLEEARRERSRSMVQVLGELAVLGDEQARWEFWSILRAGRYRWIHYVWETHTHTLGYDTATIPHWIEDLESNCCRVTDGLNTGIENLFGIDGLYGTNTSGIGQPISRRVRTELALYGGPLVWSPILDRFVAKPE